MEFSGYQIAAWLSIVTAVVAVIFLRRSEKKKPKS
jgi:hypothetical protein